MTHSHLRAQAVFSDGKVKREVRDLLNQARFLLSF